MKRYLLSELIEWKDKPRRKPLLLYGVRQVGKTHLLKHFGEHTFPRTHYFNFEKDPKLAAIFEPDRNPQRIMAELSFRLDQSINIQEDLVIFDEIQACPDALTSLKYFNEELSRLHLAAAGSLLGLHLSPTAFPVGMVDMMTLHPLSFVEFLEAIGDQKSVEFINQLTKRSTIPEVVHEHLWQKFKDFLVIGGMPEPILEFNEYSDDRYEAFAHVRKKQHELIKAYYSDMAKHAGDVNSMHLTRLWESVPARLAQTQDGTAPKFQFKDIIPGINRYNRLAGVIDWLSNANLIIKVPVVNHGELPFAAYTKENSFKLLLFDIGILGALSELPPQTILDYGFGTYKGYFAENFVAQQFQTATEATLYSWQSNRAEVEFLREIDGQVIPIEVKSGWVTQALSIKTFADKYHSPYRVIFSANNLLIDDDEGSHRYPLYLAEKFPLRD